VTNSLRCLSADTLVALSRPASYVCVKFSGEFVHRVGTPFRTATQDLEVRNVDGVRIGTTAGQFLDELNAQDDG